MGRAGSRLISDAGKRSMRPAAPISCGHDGRQSAHRRRSGGDICFSTPCIMVAMPGDRHGWISAGTVSSAGPWDAAIPPAVDIEP